MLLKNTTQSTNFNPLSFKFCKYVYKYNQIETNKIRNNNILDTSIVHCTFFSGMDHHQSKHKIIEHRTSTTITTNHN